MTDGRRHRVFYNTALMEEDAAERGWNYAYIARVIHRDRSTVTRFFAGEIQTAKVAKELAEAFGHPVSRYLIRRARRPVAARVEPQVAP